MFKKKPTIKTVSPIRSSDRRKIADRIIEDFQVQSQSHQQGEANGAIAEDDVESKAAQRAAHTTLRNSILPDNSLSARFSTTTGPDLKEVFGTVYIGSRGKSNDQRVLWFEIFDRMYPSVYTLWSVPGLIPLLHTPGIVVQKMKGGADLYTPGLAGPPFPARAKRNAIVAVASLDKPSVPVAVGTCRADVSALQTTQGSKGAAVETMHWAGDELWDWSTSNKSGIAPPESLDGWLDDGLGNLKSNTEVLSLEDDNEGGVSLDPKEQTYNSSANVNGRIPDVAEVIEGYEGEDLSTKDIDEAFRRAFIYGVYYQKQQNPGQPKYGLDFPLTQSYIMGSLVKPFLPTFTPKQTELLDMKKTSWKNIRKFIKSLEKDQLVLAKDRDRNESTILDIDFDDSNFKEFRPYALPKREHTGPAGPASASAANGDTVDPSIAQKIRRLELYRPKDSLAPLFAPSNASHKTLYSTPDLNPIISTYFEHERLVFTKDKRKITLNPFLANALFNSNTQSDAEMLNRGSVNRDVLITRIKANCTPHYAIFRNDETLSSPGIKAKSGAPPKIGIQLETRTGNKTATKVWGLEPYYVREQALADELRKACASSTSVEQSDKQGHGVSIMVQGPQKDAVIRALEKRGIKKEWVEVTDKTKGKKK